MISTMRSNDLKICDKKSGNTYFEIDEVLYKMCSAYRIYMDYGHYGGQ